MDKSFQQGFIKTASLAKKRNRLVSVKKQTLVPGLRYKARKLYKKVTEK